MAPTGHDASHDAAPGPLPAALRAIAAPAAWAYGAAVARRNRRFDRGVGVGRVPLPVVSIGNIVVGGTGKTPTVTWIARRLVEHGVRPMIALRGYGSGVPAQADEVLEYREALGSIPIAAGPRRFETIIAALRDGAVADVILLDDGFQHRALHRDLDLVLIDARRPALNEALLPAGRLREPATALGRADGVVVTHATAVDAALAEQVCRLHGRPPVAWLRHAWRGVEVHGGEPGPGHGDGEPRREPTGWLRRRRVVMSLGVASPWGVRTMLEQAGAIVVADVAARDHQRYDAARMRRLAAACRDARADSLFVTRKDWVKLRTAVRESTSALDVPVIVPILEIEPVAGAEDLVATIVAVAGRHAPSEHRPDS